VPTPDRHVTIIGGGLIGLTSALFLREAGAEVRVIDHGPLGGGASRGNAGYMCTTILGPLAGPGAIVNALKSLPRADTPLRLHPGQLPRQLGWFVAFARACTTRRYVDAQLALGRLVNPTPRLLDRIERAGGRITLGAELVAPFHDERLAHHYFDGLAPMRDFGYAMPDRILDGSEVRAVVPALTDFVNAGIVLPGERMIDPGDFVDSMIEVVTGLDVELLAEHRITGFEYRAGHISAVDTDRGRFDTDQVVLCPGAGIQRLGRLLGLRIPVIAGQGYNVVVPEHDGVKHPVITEEAHAAVTPLPGGIRIGGTMEFGGDTPRFDQRRVDAIVRSTRRFLDVDWERATSPWAGLRPMSPDGLPLIGRPRQFDNLVIAGGHGMYGLTLGPATANVVAQLVTDGRCDTDVTAFNPNRFRL
jgi:D-amino-acid dehydrogenase